MSWLFSQALVEEYSVANSLDGVPCAPLNVMPTPQLFWRNDKPMDVLKRSPFGLMWKPLTENHGEALLTWFLEDSRARTSQPPVQGVGSKDQDQDFGSKCHGSFVKYDLDTSSWKTHQYSLLEGLESFSETWPKWGLMQNGECWEFQTPLILKQRRKSLMTAIESGSQEKVPTITVCGNYNRKGASKTSGDGLATYVKKVPTPTASASKGSSPKSLTRKSGKSRENDRLDHKIMATDGGKLNPQWVEWLMGWPIGQTDLKPLEMDKFQQWQQWHGRF